MKARLTPTRSGPQSNPQWRLSGVASLFAGILIAQPLFSVNAEADGCDDAVTTLEINQCAAQAFADADARLNAVYKSVRARSDTLGKELLKSAQIAWIAYRDAECERTADVARGGTAASAIEIACRTRMTEMQTTNLLTNPLTGEMSDF